MALVESLDRLQKHYVFDGDVHLNVSYGGGPSTTSYLDAIAVLSENQDGSDVSLNLKHKPEDIDSPSQDNMVRLMGMSFNDDSVSLSLIFGEDKYKLVLPSKSTSDQHMVERSRSSRISFNSGFSLARGFYLAGLELNHGSPRIQIYDPKRTGVFSSENYSVNFVGNHFFSEKQK